MDNIEQFLEQHGKVMLANEQRREKVANKITKQFKELAQYLNKVFKKKIDLIVLGVSSKGINWASEELNKISSNKKLIFLTKKLLYPKLRDGYIK